MRSDSSARRWLGWALLLCIVYRVGYHAVYLGEVPFAVGTFSDGSIYEAAARDIAEHFPLGTRPFYLQGLYAYLLALPMLIKPWISLGLLVQLVLAGTSLWVFQRTMTRVWGWNVGTLCTLALLLYPGLSFYENKYLTASPGVAANIMMIAAVVWSARGPSWRLGLVGLAAGLAFLFRPNMLVCVPFAAYACVVLRGHHPGRFAQGLVPFALGFGLAVAPMALRNQVVTGHPDVMPVHGGGTSFYIGNNPQARGVWNDAGGLISARVEHEPAELADELGVQTDSERQRAREIGGMLYDRSFEWIAENPGDWLVLEVRKVWLSLGNDELTQDYDWYGERELLPYAHVLRLPFGLLLAFGLVGWGVRERVVAPNHEQLDARGRRALGWTVAGQALAVAGATLVFFTSAQHRLPWCVVAAVYAGPGIWALARLVGSRLGKTQPLVVPFGVLAVAGLVALQGFWPRTKRDTPHPVHYYNLAVVLDESGEPVEALPMAERAVELEPDHPIFRLKLAELRRRLGDLDASQSDFEWILEQESLPHAIREDARRQWWAIQEARKQAAGRDGEGLPPSPR